MLNKCETGSRIKSQMMRIAKQTGNQLVELHEALYVDIKKQLFLTYWRDLRGQLKGAESLVSFFTSVNFVR